MSMRRDVACNRLGRRTDVAWDNVVMLMELAAE
jgi:hypothetical protein